MTETSKSANTLSYRNEKKCKTNESNSCHELGQCSSPRRRIVSQVSSSNTRVFSALSPVNKSPLKKSDDVAKTKSRAYAAEPSSPIVEKRQSALAWENPVQDENKDKELNTRLIVRCGRNVVCKDFLQSEGKNTKVGSPRQLHKELVRSGIISCSERNSDARTKDLFRNEELHSSPQRVLPQSGIQSSRLASTNRLSFRKRNNVRESSGSEETGQVSQCMKMESGIHHNIRSTKASRLRALANNSMLETSPSKSGASELGRQVSSNSKHSVQSDSGVALPSRSPTHESSSASVIDMNENVTNKLNHQKPAVSRSQQKPITRVGSPEVKQNDSVKDKSSKRKSNLNRAIMVEEPRLVPLDPHSDSLWRSHKNCSLDSNQRSELGQRRFSTSFTSDCLSSAITQPDNSVENTQCDSKPNRKTDVCRQFPEVQSSSQNQKSSCNLRTLKTSPQHNHIANYRNFSPSKEKPQIRQQKTDYFSSKSTLHTRSPLSSPHKKRAGRENDASASGASCKTSSNFGSDQRCSSNFANDISKEKEHHRDNVMLQEFQSKKQELINAILEYEKQIEEGHKSILTMCSSNGDNQSPSHFDHNNDSKNLETVNAQAIANSCDNTVNLLENIQNHQAPTIHSVSLKLSSPQCTTTSAWNSVIMDSPNNKLLDCLPSDTNNIDVNHKKILKTDCHNSNSFKTGSFTSSTTFHDNPPNSLECNKDHQIRPRTKSLEHIKYGPRKLSESDLSERCNNDSRQPLSILKRKSVDEQEIELNLKPTISDTDNIKKPHSILKKRESSDEKELSTAMSELHSILKKGSSEERRERSSSSPEIHPILKHRSFDDDSTTIEPRPILKKKSSIEEIYFEPTKPEPKPILKKKFSMEEDLEERPRPILKTRRRSHDERNIRDIRDDFGGRSILRRISAEDMLKTIDHSLDSHLETDLSLFVNDQDHFLTNSSCSASNSFGGTVQPVSCEISKLSGAVLKPKFSSSQFHATSILKKHYIKPISALVPNCNGDLKDTSMTNVENSWDSPSIHFAQMDSGALPKEKQTSSQSQIATKDPTLEDGADKNLSSSLQLQTSDMSNNKADSSLDMQPTQKPKSSNEVSAWRARFDRRNTARYHTQPVTSGEINETDSLESVQAFRALVQKKTSHNIFKALETDSLSKVEIKDTKIEYPQPYRPEKRQNRRQGSRYRTLPISLEKINETEKFELVSPAKVLDVAKESDISKQTESDDELSRMSVAAKKSLFQQLEFQQKTTKTRVQSRFYTRKTGSRSQTQPITEEEVHQASKMVEDEHSKRNSKDIDTTNGDNADVTDNNEHSKQQIKSDEFDDKSGTKKMDETIVDANLPIKSEKTTTSDSEDDPSKLTLAEKMKLFSQKVTQDMLKPSITGPPPRRNRSLARFKTQPITFEEIDKAASLASQSEEHEERKSSIIRNICRQGTQMMPCLSQLKSVLESRQQILSDSDDEDKQKGILKHSKDAGLSDIRSILKTDGSTANESKELRGILKSTDDIQGDEKPLRSVLKKPDKDPKSVPKSDYSSESESSQSSLSSSDDDDDDIRGQYEGSKQVLTGGQSHLVINPILNQEQSPHKKIANQAVQRRLNAALRRKEEKKSIHELRTSTHVSVKEEKSISIRSQCTTEAESRGFISPQRSYTQPLTIGEKEDIVVPDGGSIAERLAALHRSGEEEWRKRLTTLKTDDPEEEIKTSLTVIKREVKQGQSQRPSSIADRLSQLEEAQAQWRARVEEKDATKFTVAGKMGQMVPQQSPLLDRERRTPKPVRFRSKTTCIDESLKNTGSPCHSVPISKSKSMPNALRKEPNISSTSSSESEDDLSTTRVLVPKADNETFTSFFESLVPKKSEEKIEINEDVLNEITSESHQLLAQRRSIRLQTRRSATRNPIRALASRTDLQQEYTELKTGVAERELRNMKVEQLAKTSDLALSALAGLASTEDFKAIALKRSSTSEGSALLPIRDVMLVQVKGRRHIQTRLVEPVVSSINHGDCYILVTHDEVFCWIGELSNIIEHAKSTEIASTVQLKKDLCFKGTSDVITIDETKNPSPSQKENFFRILGGKEEECGTAGSPNEDEIYEAFVLDTNMVYKVEDDALTPYQEYWGSLPRIEMLQPDQVLVFDFGSEMYVWLGKKAPFEKRKVAYFLAKELWEQGYDYSECDINPLNAGLEQKIPLKGTKRPDWAIFTKINQHMEPVLFKEKFFDWPDLSRIIKVKSQDAEEAKSEDVVDMKPCNTKEMLEHTPEEPDLVLEGSHLGRGREYHELSEKRHFEITTLAVKIWHILEYDHSLLPGTSYGHFHSGDTYVVRWQYMITQTGRDLYGKMSRHSFVGRERCAYFFWQGNGSTITEKGASALMTVELDEERGPQIRVIQGKEPPCFMNLFEGGMVIYLGRREESLIQKMVRWRLFMVQGEITQEAALFEVPCSTQSLRSRSSFALVETEAGIVYIWHGIKAKIYTRETILAAVNKLVDKKPKEMFQTSKKITVNELDEGFESKEFWAGLGGRNRHMYLSLIESGLSYDYTPRLFYLNSISGTFTYNEIVCPHFSTKHFCPYPFLQSDLYKAQQPALFLVDNESEVYLWQGWMPEGTEDTENVSTGSAFVRWNNDRRCAMETVLHYCQDKCNDNPPKAYLVSAGLEPAVFTNLFPQWQQKDDVAILNIKDGKKPGEMLFVQEVLCQLTRMHYPLSELQQQSLPEGVNPSRLESYLTDKEFEAVFTMNKDEFYNLPTWIQCKLKKSATLF